MSMGVWHKPQEWFKKFRQITLAIIIYYSYRISKKDLRKVCRGKYGDDFAEMYDMVNNSIPIGNLEET